MPIFSQKYDMQLGAHHILHVGRIRVNMLLSGDREAPVRLLSVNGDIQHTSAER